MDNERMDDEVFALVKRNPSRAVDLDKAFNRSRPARRKKKLNLAAIFFPVYVVIVMAIAAQVVIQRAGWQAVIISVLTMVASVVAMGLFRI